MVAVMSHHKPVETRARKQSARLPNPVALHADHAAWPRRGLRRQSGEQLDRARHRPPFARVAHGAPERRKSGNPLRHGSTRLLQTPTLLRRGDDPLYTLCADPPFGSWRLCRKGRRRLSFALDSCPSCFLRECHFPAGRCAEFPPCARSGRSGRFDFRCRGGCGNPLNLSQRGECSLDCRFLPFELIDDAAQDLCHYLILPRVWAIGNHIARVERTWRTPEVNGWGDAWSRRRGDE